MKEEQMDIFMKRFDGLFHKAIKKMTITLEEKVAPLTGPQFYILKLLHTHPTITVTQVADIMNVKPSSITYMIDRLEKVQYVTRERDEEDRRVVYLVLSHEGKRVIQEKEEKRLEMIKNILHHFTETEIETWLSVHEKMMDVMDKKK